MSHLSRAVARLLLSLVSALLIVAPAASLRAYEGAEDNWASYHHDSGRSGADPMAPIFSSAVQSWVSNELDGDVYAEPLYVGNRVLIATENDSVYALDANTGQEVWHTHLAEPAQFDELGCGNIRPVVGITSTPVADPGAGVLYAVALEHSPLHYELYAVALADGSVRFHRSLDPPGLEPRNQGQRGALLLAHGRVYVTFGNRSYPSCEPWRGWVLAASATDLSTPLLSYSPPTTHGGIWAPGGPTLDAAGNVYVATGDGAGSPTFGLSESVIKLSPTLEQLDFWAPRDWLDLDEKDIDIGSVSPTLIPDLDLVFQAGKSSMGYLLSMRRLGGIGGDLYSQQVVAGQCGGVAGGTAYRFPLVYVPCGPQIVALRVDVPQPYAADLPGFALEWRSPADPRRGAPNVGSPIVAGGAVWYVDLAGGIYAADAGSGDLKFQDTLPGPPAHFSTPSSGGGRIYVAAGRRISAFQMLVESETSSAPDGPET